MNELDKAYLAGVVDSEGSIMLTNRSGLSVQVQITQVNEPWLETLRAIFGKGRIIKVQNRNTEWSDKWVWYLAGKNAVELLQACLPYMKLKGAEAELVIEAYANCGSMGRNEKEETVRLIKMLKHSRRGLSVATEVPRITRSTDQRRLFEF